MSFATKLTNNLKSSIPLVYIVTNEERRVCNDVLNIFKEKERVTVYEWDPINLLTRKDKNNPALQSKMAGANCDPKNIIETVKTLGNPPERSVVLMKDFHFHIEAPGMIRMLRNAIEALKVKGNMIIFVSPILKIPVDLDKDITTLDYSLPGPDEIEQALRAVERTVQTNHKDKLSIKLEPEIVRAAVQAAQGMTLNEIDNAFTLGIVTHQAFNNDFVATVFEEKIQQVKKSGLLTYIPSNITFDQIGGLDQLKSWMKVRGHAYSAEAKTFGLPNPKGVLLCGIPGAGKSLLAKAIAHEFGFPLFQLDIGGLFAKHVGETEENFRRVIAAVEGLGRCVLYIDEIEKAMNRDAVSGRGDTGTSSRSFGTFLSWLNDRKGEIFVVGTSNNHTVLPTELIRKGRFDESFWLDLPTPHEREEIFNVLLKKYKREASKFKTRELADNCPGFTGAEIEQVILSSMFTAFEKGKKDITIEGIKDEINATIPLSTTCKADIDRMRDNARGKLKWATPEEEEKPKQIGIRKVELS